MNSFLKSYKMLAFAALLLALQTQAQAPMQDSVKADRVSLKRDGSYLTVGMTLRLSEVEAEGDRAVLITPLLENGDTNKALRPIGIYSRNRYFHYARQGKGRMLGGADELSFKEKDKIYKQYRELMDAHFERLHISISDRRLNSFKSNISNATQNGKNDSLYREREKLLRTYENLRSEVQTYENNIGFLNASSKKGNSLVNELLRKVEKLKDELSLIQKKIDVVDETLRKEEE